MNPSPDPASIPLVRLHRAGFGESLHRGRYVLLEGDAVAASGGDIAHPVFVRSTAKPLQALVGVTSGAVDRFGLDTACLAVATGSHSGTAAHLEAAGRTLERAGVDVGALKCGGHWSIHAETARAQVLPDGVDTPPPLWSNCSGKHAMMLATTRAFEAPLETYLSPGHPTQDAILDAVAALSGLSRDVVDFAVDGCGAPAPHMPLERMAYALQRFACPEDLLPPWQDAAVRVTQAMYARPDLVAGPGRFDTDLMQAVPGNLLAKCGAEGLMGVMVPDRKLALAIKVDDGADRGYQLFVIALLRELGILERSVAEVLSARHAPTILLNHAGDEVGTAEALLPVL